MLVSKRLENVAQVLHKNRVKFPRDFFAPLLSTKMTVLTSGAIKELLSFKQVLYTRAEWELYSELYAIASKFIVLDKNDQHCIVFIFLFFMSKINLLQYYNTCISPFRASCWSNDTVYRLAFKGIFREFKLTSTNNSVKSSFNLSCLSTCLV